VKNYEAMFLFDNVVVNDWAAIEQEVRRLLERIGASLHVCLKFDERKLAYEIKGQKRGLFVIAYFNAAPTAIGAIEREVNLSDDVLRVLVTDADHMNKEEMEKVEPQPIQPREERAPWDRPGFNNDGPRGNRGGDDRGGDRGDRGGDRAPRREPAEAAKE
jgi:small subunit ribosomal protein S6